LEYGQVNLNDARVAVLVENQYQELELWYPILRLLEEGADVVVVGPSTDVVYASKLGYPVVADVTPADIDLDDFDAVIVPGGFAPEGIRRSQPMLDVVRGVDARGGVVATICHAGWVLASSGIARGKTATCVPIVKDDVINAGINYVDEEVVRDGNLITSRAPSDLPVWVNAIVEALREAPEHDEPRSERLGGKNASPEFTKRARIVPDARGVVATPNYGQTATVD
jgi:protease I